MDIIEIIPSYLYSVKYDNQTYDEFHRVFHYWNDVESLVDFFRAHIDYLSHPFWGDFKDEPEKAAKTVVVDAMDLECYIHELAKNAQNSKRPDFDEYFHPLNGKYIYEWNHIPMKGYGVRRPTFLRLYAIKMGQNCYLLVYGGLKLSDTIQDSPVLKEQVFKRIDKTLEFLKQEAIADGDDLLGGLTDEI